MEKQLRLALAHAESDLLATLAEALGTRHSIVAACSTVAELRAAVLNDRPELVVTGIEFPDGDGLDLMIELSSTNPLPSVIVSAERSIALVEKAMRDHVMAYLLEPVRAEELEPAIIVAQSRFEQFEALTQEVHDLRQALHDRKVIERAKGALMAAEGLSETDAFAKIRSEAQKRRVRLIDIANELLNAARQ